MKLFIDSADVSEIQEHFATGLIDGVTTNPTLIMKSGRNPEEVYQELIDTGIQDTSMEVVGDRNEMLGRVVDLLINLISKQPLKYLVHQMVYGYVKSYPSQVILKKHWHKMRLIGPKVKVVDLIAIKVYIKNIRMIHI